MIEGLREKNVVLEFLHRDEQRKSEQLRQVNAIAREITPILDIETLVRTVLDLIGPAFDFEAVSFGLIEGRELRFRGGRLDGQRMKARGSLFFGLTGGGERPFVRSSSRSEGDREDANKSRQMAISAPAHSPYDLVFPLNRAVPDGEQTVGFWVADWSEDAEFREENLPYLDSLAAQTVVVLENARLYAVAKRVDELAFLNQVGRAANQRLDLTETIRSVLQCVQGTFDSSVVEIVLLDEFKNTERAFALLDGVFWQGEQPLLGKAFAPRAGTQPLVLSGQTGTPKTIQVPANLVPGMGPLTVRSSLGALLRFRGRQIGLLGVASTRTSAYTAEDGRLLQIAGAQMATLIQNARLFQEVESARKVILQSRDTLRTLFDGILEGIYIVDRDSVILAINRTQADWAGKSFGDLVGGPADLAFPSSRRSLDLIRETFRTGEPMSCAERQRTGGAEYTGDAERSGQWTRGGGRQWTEWEIHTYPVMQAENRSQNGNGTSDHLSSRALRFAPVDGEAGTVSRARNSRSSGSLSSCAM